MDSAAGVRGLSRRVDVAVAGCHRAGETTVIDGAAGARVQGHVVGDLVVDAFDDVDFAVVGPVRTDGPAVWY